MIKLILKYITRLKQRYRRYKDKQHLNGFCRKCLHYELCKAISETHLRPKTDQELAKCEFYTPKAPR